MKALPVVVALVAALSACALPAGSGPATSNSYQPLRAYINPPEFGGLGFQVNRPAYVAMFEVVPGQGAAQVYPSIGSGPMSGYATVGRAHIGTRRVAARDLYLPAHSQSRLQEPRYYLLIASESPLNLEPFGSFGMGLRSSLGVHFASYNPYHTMERLAETVLPTMQYDGSWTTDLYVHWPEAISATPADRHVLLSCNGYRVYVRIEYLARVHQTLCGQQEAQPVRGDTVTAPRGPGDSAAAPRAGGDDR
jgi:hypothetical protein